MRALRTAGLSFIALGAVCALAAAAAGGLVLVRRAAARRVAAVALPTGQRVDTGWIDVDTRRLCQVTVQALVETPEVDHRRRRRRADEYKPVFSFPLQYRVLDSSGNLFFEETAKVPSSLTGPSKQRVRGGQGRVEAEHYYGKFTPPPDGRIRLQAELAPDLEHGATVRAQLMVYDNVSAQLKMSLVAVVLGAAGGFSFIGGGVLALLGNRARPRSPADASR